MAKPVREHWQSVYDSREEDAVSWFQPRPSPSLRLIENAGLSPHDAIIDVGGGASRLVDMLLDAGYDNVAVLDIAPAALAISRRRLAARGTTVTWVESDITRHPPTGQYRLWHDRAMFHYLRDACDRDAYRSAVNSCVQSDGQLVIGTFAADGPARCSGLDVMRYDPASLEAFFAPHWDLVEVLHDTHVTPWETQQRFMFCRFQRIPAAQL